MPAYNQSRSRIIQVIFIAVFLVIILQLLNLQLFSSKYRLQAENNARYRKVIYPDRGIIYDRNKKAILENTIMFDLMVTPSEIKHTDTLTLCHILGIDTAEFKKRIVEAGFKNSRVRPSVFEPLLSQQLWARLNENMYRFPGFELHERPVRLYPYHCGANVLGYVGEIDSNFLKRHQGQGYEMGDYAGLAGLERTYEKILMGQRGINYFIRDNRSRIQGSYEAGAFDTVPLAGRALYTSVDVDIQQLAEKLLGNKIGSVVAINPKTGGILAMATSPSYDPNMMSGSEKRKNYGRLALDTARPFLNRAIKGQYPPGSTFKPMGGLVALDEGLIKPSYGYDCPGAYTECGITIRCEHKGGGHASSLRHALANSCNSYFSEVFRKAVDNPIYKNPRLGYLKWKEYMNSFGLGVKLGVDLPSEDAGNIPDTSKYNKDFGGPRWNSCNIVTLGIGQDRMLATPLQLANLMCVIGNKGWFYTPHVVDSIEHESIEDTAYLSRYRRKHLVTHMSDTAFNAIHLAMLDVTLVGTAVAAKIPGIDICAKTGTAQNPHGKNHSLFVAFAPMQDPKIAIAVVVENAGYGATWAAPIASLLMEKYLKGVIDSARLSEVDRIAKADLIPDAIKSWYLRKEEQKRARQMEPAQIEFKNTDEHPKLIFDPEAEPNRKPQRADTELNRQFMVPVNNRKAKPQRP